MINLSKLIALTSFVLTTGCGIGVSSSKSEVEIRDYVFSLAKEKDLFEQDITDLINEFNLNARLEILKYSSDRNSASALVYVKNGLFDNTGAVGRGQMIGANTTVKEDFGTKEDSVTSYGMYIELDRDFMLSRPGKNDAIWWYDKRKLFFHEVGHGLGFEHEPNDVNNLMYPSTDGDKDLNGYFSRVRALYGI